MPTNFSKNKVTHITSVFVQFINMCKTRIGERSKFKFNKLFEKVLVIYRNQVIF